MSFKLSSNFKKPLTLLMMGGPGVGKGTFSRLLSKDFGLPELSSGNELRRITQTGEGKFVEEIKKIKNSGKLVGDDLIFEIISKRLDHPEFEKGVILDGYPRTVNQIKQFLAVRSIDMSIKIELNENILIKKITGRRECEKCGRNYNLFSFKDNGYDMDPLLPKVEGKCDDCYGCLMQRSDDNEHIIKERLDVYNRLTLPMELYFKKINIPILKFEPKRGVKDYEKFREYVLQNISAI